MLATSPKQVSRKAVFHYFFCLFNKHVKTLPCSLNVWIGYSTTKHLTEWCIKYGVIKTTEKVLQPSK